MVKMKIGQRPVVYSCIHCTPEYGVVVVVVTVVDVVGQSPQ